MRNNFVRGCNREATATDENSKIKGVRARSLEAVPSVMVSAPPVERTLSGMGEADVAGDFLRLNQRFRRVGQHVVARQPPSPSPS